MTGLQRRRLLNWGVGLAAARGGLATGLVAGLVVGFVAADLGLAGLVAVPRPGATTVTAAELAAQLGLPVERVRLKLVECPAIDIASREIRARVAAGKTIRFLVPRSIEEYVRERKLYAAPV